LAFSNFLKMTLFEGDDLAGSLLGFNLGIEAGQLLIVAVFLATIQGVLFVFKQLRHNHMITACSILILLGAFSILWNLL
jgi:hypothetical protein